ncbi:DNA adenine methylase [Schaalia georgiae]|uniref:DNA adenine methylase n=1 Tax=Schaalia georgiae TaxID=52768 RepID=UPI0009D93D2A|nr:DNA adenine methylase [Schaalia georgiae]
MTDRLRVIGSRRYGTLSPLRYPGGKAALAGFFTDIIHALNITDACYIEPYAGGAGAGIALLLNRVVQHLVINDIDPAVHAFWKSVIDNNSEFVKLVSTTPLTINEWHRQRTIYRTKSEDDILNLGFAFFYLNRTNRSGILNAGVIGGQRQEGKYKIDARFNRSALIERLTTIGRLASQITVSDSDGRTVIQQHANDKQTFMYIDPPYVQAGSKLYLNAFDGRDHQALSTIVKAVDRAHWLVTYDTSPLIEKLYQDQFQCRLELTYAARHPGKAEELLVASPSVAKAIKAVQAVSQEAPAANV